MEDRSDLAQLIDDAYVAAIDPSCWAEWTWRATQLLGGRCGGLHVVDVSGNIEHQTIRHRDMAVVERYVADAIGRFDPQIPYAARLRQCCVYADTDHLDPDDPGTREYLAWQRSNGGLRHYVTALVPLLGADRVAGLSIHFGADEGPASAAHRATMAALLPHLARAVVLGFAHAGKVTEAYWDGLLGARSEPCALIAGDARILRMTEPMAALVAARDGLACRDGRLVMARDGAGGALEQLLARVAGDRTRAAARRIERASGHRPYLATAYPLPRRRAFLVPEQAAALVTIIDPDWSPCPPETMWRDAFGLSAREAEIAALLLVGHSVESAAERLGISRPTARVHLRNLFAKVQVNRQSDLVRLLSRRT